MMVARISPLTLTPRPWQQTFMARSEREGLLVTNNRAGRSTALILDALQVLRHPYTRVLFLAPSFRTLVGAAGVATAFGRLACAESGWRWLDSRLRWMNTATHSHADFAVLMQSGDELYHASGDYQGIYWDNINAFAFSEDWRPYERLLRSLCERDGVPPRVRAAMCYHSTIDERLRERFVPEGMERVLPRIRGEGLYSSPDAVEGGSFYYYVA